MSYPLFDKDEHWHKPEQAFLTDDHRTILRFAVEALMSGKGAVLVTLVEIRGGAARPLGAQMVVREDGRYCGFVSGGCVEAAAAFEALEMMGSGRDREIRYGEGSPWFDIVLPCGGGITLTLHKLRSAQPLLAVLNRLEQRKPVGLRYDPQAQSLVCLPTQTRTGWGRNGFEVGFRPCVRLMIYGRSLEAHQLMVALAVLGLSVAALYGCYQSYIGVDIVASQQDMNLNQGMPGRVYSFFDNPNNFAEQLAMLLPLNLALFLNSRWRGKLLSLLSLGVGLVAIGATYGRASWIGLAGAVLVFLALLNWRWVPVFLLVGLAAIPFLPETIYNRILTIFNAGEDSSVQYRFGIYETTRNLMEDYWARGVGLGTDVMKKVFQTYPTNFDGSYPVHTHNNYLQMWGETGILGLLAYLSLLLYQLKSGVKGFCAALDPRVKRMMAAAIGAFCGILVIGVAEYTWYYPRNMFTYWFLFGVIGACIKLVRMEQDKQAA